MANYPQLYDDFYLLILRSISRPRDFPNFCLINKRVYNVIKQRRYPLLFQIKEEKFKNPFESVIKNKIVWARKIRDNYYGIARSPKIFTFTTLQISIFKDKKYRAESRSKVLKGKGYKHAWFELNHRIRAKLKIRKIE